MILTHAQLQALPQAAECPRPEHPYLANCIVRAVQDGDRRGLTAGDIIAAGNGTLTLTAESHTYVPAQGPPAEPTVTELAVRFAGAVSQWVAAGAPVVGEAEYRARDAACTACPLWDSAARFGLGRCKHHRCGCTSLKRWLATEQCPLGYWPV